MPGRPVFSPKSGQKTSWAGRQGIDTLFANADEAAILAGAHDAAGTLAALAEHYPAVVLKRGAAGASAIAAGAVASQAAPAVAAIDSTGAGDAFLAGFLHARLRGAALAGCLAGGVALGARAATLLGGRPPQP